MFSMNARRHNQGLKGSQVVKSYAEVSTIAPKADAAYRRLKAAIGAGRSLKTCLRYWSVFVRARDDERCVVCSSERNISAHHICRKSLIFAGVLDTGNGMTLCGDCHQLAHKGFNGRPDFLLPMDTQGGEKIEMMCELYGILLEYAYERGIYCEDYYAVSDDVLITFKKLQGFSAEVGFPGGSLLQAWLIWRQPQMDALNAIFTANGFPERTSPMLPGIVVHERWPD
jgi:hypothetical protein